MPDTARFSPPQVQASEVPEQCLTRSPTHSEKAQYILIGTAMLLIWLIWLVFRCTCAYACFLLYSTPIELERGITKIVGGAGFVRLLEEKEGLRPKRDGGGSPGSRAPRDGGSPTGERPPAVRGVEMRVVEFGSEEGTDFGGSGGRTAIGDGGAVVGEPVRGGGVRGGEDTRTVAIVPST